MQACLQKQVGPESNAVATPLFVSAKLLNGSRAGRSRVVHGRQGGRVVAAMVLTQSSDLLHLTVGVCCCVALLPLVVLLRIPLQCALCWPSVVTTPRWPLQQPLSFSKH